MVLEAEGRKEAAFRDAEARERSAEAEAKATEMVSIAIAAGDVQAINYFVANNYIKALEAIATVAEPEGADAAARGGLGHRLDRAASPRSPRKPSAGRRRSRQCAAAAACPTSGPGA